MVSWTRQVGSPGHHFWTIFGRSQFWSWQGTSYPETSFDCPQSLQANARIVAQVRSQPLPSKFFHFINHQSFYPDARIWVTNSVINVTINKWNKNIDGITSQKTVILWVVEILSYEIRNDRGDQKQWSFLRWPAMSILTFKITALSTIARWYDDRHIISRRKQMYTHFNKYILCIKYFRAFFI
jgi:hypothetical protein